MKGRVIFYGWLFSWILLFAGLGTMEWAMETGDLVFMKGLALFMVFVVFSVLVIQNQKIVDEEAKQFDLFLCKSLEKLGRWLGID